jgi:glycosyltransferase involved in cell wall biosynthesis
LMPVRIAILGTRGFPGVQGGVESHCENLAVNLAALGCDVIVFTRKPYTGPGTWEYKGVRLAALPAPRRKTFEALLHTLTGIAVSHRYGVDIIHIHGIGPGVLAPLARILGFKVVLTSHGSNYRHDKWNRAEKLLLKLCESIAVRYCDCCIAVSDVIADEIRRLYGVSPLVIPNGVQAVEAGETCIRPDGEKIPEGKYILAVGRFVPEKGLHDLVEAFSDSGPDGWKLVIAGSADHKSRYAMDLRKRAQTGGDVILTGVLPRNAMNRLYSNAGLFVLPSYYEGMSMALLEALSFGLTCLVSDIPSNRAVGLPEENYFKPGDVCGLKEKIRLFANIQRTEEEKLRQIVDLTKKYNWRDIAYKTLMAYEEAAK